MRIEKKYQNPSWSRSCKTQFMAKIQRFSEIPVWNRARELVKAVYVSTSTGPFSKDWALRDQIRKAAISIPSNIAEGFERGGTGEFIQFLSIAKGSTGEVMTQLYLANDLGYLGNEAFVHLLAMTEEIGRMIGGFTKYLRNSEIKGAKYR